MPPNPNTTFTTGNVLTAAQMNRLPWGIIAYQSINTPFSTSAPHTTLQNNGATLTINEVSGRLYKITYSCYPYPSGGQQSITMNIQRSAVSIKSINLFSGMASTAFAPGVTHSVLYLATASASVTYRVQMAAATANTTVTDYGDAGASIRQFWIEDMGPA
jgi:hypothetical protein